MREHGRLWSLGPSSDDAGERLTEGRVLEAERRFLANLAVVRSTMPAHTLFVYLKQVSHFSRKYK